ncbi:GNAT family N-acetyltransferase [Candidatus Dojkabacteria bacterium]|nr:GNAT family N-acetyltransferase [Candidatus Dojkabacteria bacterium]
MDDLQQIETIEKETFRNGGVNLNTLRSLENTFKDGLIIIKEQKDVLAYLGWEIHKKQTFPPYNHDISKTHDESGNLGYISIITVRKEYRNKGLGSKLLNILIAVSKRYSCKNLYCPVNKKHPYLKKGVLHFWEKNGFKISGETNWEIEKGKLLPSFIFSKQL